MVIDNYCQLWRFWGASKWKEKVKKKDKKKMKKKIKKIFLPILQAKTMNVVWLVFTKPLPFTISLLVLPIEAVQFVFLVTVLRRNVDIWRTDDLPPIVILIKSLKYWSRLAVWMNNHFFPPLKKKKNVKTFFFTFVNFFIWNEL